MDAALGIEPAFCQEEPKAGTPAVLALVRAGWATLARVSDEGGVAIEFDPEGRVRRCDFEAMFVPHSPSLSEQVVNWLWRLWP